MTIQKFASKLEVAQKISKMWTEEGLLGSKVWSGGDEVRVYLAGGFVKIGKFDLYAKALKFDRAYQVIRDLRYEIDESLAVTPVRAEWEIKGYTSQIDFDMEDPNGMYYG